MLLSAGQRARIAAQERKMSADFVAQAHSKTSLLNRSYAAARYRVPASGRKSAAYRATCRRPVRRLYPGKGKPREERVEYHRLATRSEEHTSELQSLMRISYAVFCLKKKNTKDTQN